jgi:CheY-like chemotaxis protein
VRPAADAKGIQIHTVFDPDAGSVAGDAARLQQVVWNLLMNAVKFTPHGGEVFTLLQRVDAQVQILIKDTGQGIAPELLPHVFERFRQADSSSTRPHSGLGLGLALVKHLVELQGGTVAAESAGVGRGATFTVMLPSAPPIAPTATDATSAQASSRDGKAALVRLDGVQVLLTDDDHESIAVAEAILTSAGAQVRTCHSAAAAFDLLRQWRPDVLVSDIEMPNEDGYALIRKVRALGVNDGGQTPAVALTAYGGPQDRLRCLTAGFNMHVPKPVDPGELTAIVAGVIA